MAVLGNRNEKFRAGRALKTLATLACLSLSACLDAQRKTDLRYDAKTDEFHFIKLYYNIKGDKDSDVDYLKALYANRDNILLYDVFPFLSENAGLRLRDGTYRQFSLGDRPDGTPDAMKTPVDLAKIKIEPGKFFLSPDKTLGYYCQYTIPGPVFDSVLVTASEQLEGSVAGMAASETQRRLTGKILSWDDGRKKIMSALQGQTDAPPPAPAPAPAAGDATTQDSEPGPLSVLTSDSLAILQEAVQEKALIISRKGTEFTLTLKLSAADAKELKGTWDAVKKDVDARALTATDPDMKKSLELGKKGMAILTVGDPREGVITATADAMQLTDFFRQLQAMDAGFAAKDATKDADYARLVDGLKASAIAPDETMKLDQVLPMFEKGTLPAALPEKPVQPGEGMFQAPAGTLP